MWTYCWPRRRREVLIFSMRDRMGGRLRYVAAPICLFDSRVSTPMTSHSLLNLEVTVSLYPVWRAQLWYAASVGKNDCVYALLEAGADPCLAQVTAQGVSRTPLDIA
jgi:hypothetical protein